MTDDRRERGARWIASAGLQPTRRRVALAAILVGDGRDRHVTADGLHRAAREAGESVSLATVYNALRAFRDAGLLREVAVDGARSWFDTRTDAHPHFYWEETGELADAALAPLELSDMPEAPEGTEIAAVGVVIRLRSKADLD